MTTGKGKIKRKEDFDILEPIGNGAFGQVLKVQDKETEIFYAMKILSKSHILKEKKLRYVTVERDVMTKLSHPNITKLFLTFQDPGNLYYVVELGQNGDLQKKIPVPMKSARIILGQLLLGLAHMHQKRILHRDLKPENILLDGKNRVKITDFGTARLFADDEPFEAPKGSFVGSADYVSPEVLNNGKISPASDLWSFGCILFSIIDGKPPFYTGNMMNTFAAIEKGTIDFPPSFLPQAKDLVQKLLKLEPSERLGFNEYPTNYKPIRDHPFFSGLDWETLPLEEVPPFDDDEPFILPPPATAEVPSSKASSKPPPSDSPPDSSPSPKASSPAPSSPAPAPPTPTYVVDPAKYLSLINSPNLLDESKQFLIQDEVIIYQGLLWKRVGLSNKERLFVITTRPRIFYWDLKGKKFKGEIPLSKELEVSIEKGGKFILEVPGRVYKLESKNHDENTWVEVLQAIKANL